MIKKYWVISGEMEFRSSSELEPPEIGRCAVEIVAPNQREAKILALKTKEFKPWVAWQRADSKNPFVGLKVIQQEEK